MATPSGGQATFADAPASQPFYRYIETAAAEEIIAGYACGGAGGAVRRAAAALFPAGANVTRGQLAKIVVGAAGCSTGERGARQWAVTGQDGRERSAVLRPLWNGPASAQLAAAALQAVRALMGNMHFIGSAAWYTAPAGIRDQIYLSERRAILTTDRQGEQVQSINARSRAWVPPELEALLEKLAQLYYQYPPRVQ